ncbi:dihydroorotase [Parasulfuritortus cantonensis]|uniref:Dihydroorotase n=1 Tax=Parasulfuritortus cantonensis TaxID=2528202 RepID=A0A4R1B5X1_9PROT|nr:dihydroorotase [Parasulfuritortus cantonensis]TCJ11937.1 dihydroorotase [Parasulfuritortus cantonensis]
MKIKISNGRVIDPASGLDAVRDIYIAAGRIVALGAAPADFHANAEVDASGLVVAPGLVDLSVRLREPGLEYMATLESEMHAAAVGGITSLACPPDTDPPLDEPGLVEMLKFRAKNSPGPRVYPIGALTWKLKGERLTEMAELSEAGCVAFSQADDPIVDTMVLLRAMEYAYTFGYPLWLRPQDFHLARSGVVHDGVVSARYGLPAIPVPAETVALQTILLLVRETKARVHLCRLSSRAGVEMVRKAKADGLPVTCDVGVHHVHLSELDTADFNANCHLVPPLRSQRDRDALRAALLDGTIDCICSDHAPVDADAKEKPFQESEAGATGVELLLPLTLKWGAEAGLSLAESLDRVTRKPADILGVDGGRIGAGKPADLCLFDPDAPWTVSTKSLASLGKNSPFLGMELQGRVRYTVIDGHLDYRAG